MLIVFSGVSASGKNTIMKELENRLENLFILTESTATTRPPRESDSEFNTYKFMSNDEFEKMIDNNQFFEFENVHGYYYGTIKDAIEKAANDKNNFFMRDIDVHGHKKLKSHYKDKVVSIFLDAPDEILRERLALRGEDEDRINVRLSRGELERQHKGDYDLVINNLDKEKTIEIICEYLKLLNN